MMTLQIYWTESITQSDYISLENLAIKNSLLIDLISWLWKLWSLQYKDKFFFSTKMLICIKHLSKPTEQ